MLRKLHGIFSILALPPKPIMAEVRLTSRARFFARRRMGSHASRRSSLREWQKF